MNQLFISFISETTFPTTIAASFNVGTITSAAASPTPGSIATVAAAKSNSKCPTTTAVVYGSKCGRDHSGYGQWTVFSTRFSIWIAQVGLSTGSFVIAKFDGEPTSVEEEVAGSGGKRG